MYSQAKREALLKDMAQMPVREAASKHGISLATAYRIQRRDTVAKPPGRPCKPDLDNLLKRLLGSRNTLHQWRFVNAGVAESKCVSRPTAFRVLKRLGLYRSPNRSLMRGRTTPGYFTFYVGIEEVQLKRKSGANDSRYYLGMAWGMTREYWFMVYGPIEAGNKDPSALGRFSDYFTKALRGVVKGLNLSPLLCDAPWVPGNLFHRPDP